MSELCIDTVASGGVLLVCWCATLLFYVVRRGRLGVAYIQASKALPAHGCNVFWVFETAAVFSWFALSILLLSSNATFSNCDTLNAFFGGTVLFGLSAALWPNAVEDYDAAVVNFPALEDFAVFATACGALVMFVSTIAFDPPSGVSQQAAVGLSAYVAFHYTVVDLILWTALRWYMHKSRRTTQRRELIMQDNWSSNG